MCNNIARRNGYFLHDYKATKALERFWSANGNAGLAAIWTDYAPEFFDMAETAPSEVVRYLKTEYQTDGATVLRWIETVSADPLH